MENAPSVPARKTYSSITAIPKRNRQNTAARSATDNISYVTLNIPPPPSKENLQVPIFLLAINQQFFLFFLIKFFFKKTNER